MARIVVTVVALVLTGSVALLLALDFASPRILKLAQWGVAAAAVLVLLGLAGAAEARAAREHRRWQEERWRSAHWGEEVEALRDEVRRVAEKLVPWVLERLDDRASAETILVQLGEPGALPKDPVVREVAETVVRVLHQERRRYNAAVQVQQECAARGQAAVTDLLAEVFARKQPYWAKPDSSGSEEMVSADAVRTDFFAIEARLSAMQLLSQRQLALCGARRIGRPWQQPVELDRLVRTAMGATEGHQRVVRSSQLPVAVVSPVVNTVIHVLSEVIANAVRYSPPTTQVHVSAEDVPAGLMVHVDDSGLTMTQETLALARRTVDLHEPLDWSALSGNRLGLAAARLSAARYGLSIAFGVSPALGTRVAVFIPRLYLTRPPGQVPAAPVSLTRRHAGSPLAIAPAARKDGPLSLPAAPKEPLRTGPSGLPMRPRRTRALDHQPRESSPEAAVQRSAEETGRRLSGFRQAARGLPSAPTPPPSSSDVSETRDEQP
ncbi:ATP-binding protein [Streptomyces sp. NPDC057654]|uniref:ATP-binding protein n=1 Tax=Streptomyces sp. NPDC057654 TaxID=3346196 RepID=UPI003682E248